jgi:hypothetical protein
MKRCIPYLWQILAYFAIAIWITIFWALFTHWVL